MLKIFRHWAVLVPFAFLLAAAGYWNLTDDKDGNLPTEGSPAHIIDFYMTNSHILQFNEDGTPKYEFSSERMDHLQKSDVSLVRAPRILLYRENDNPWLIHSQRGEAGPDGKEIQLFDQVRVEHEDTKERPFLLTTEHLVYLTDTDHAHTREPVQINTAQGVTNATGMHAYLKEGKVNLLAKVRGQYETEK